MDHDLTHTWDLVRQAQGGNGTALDRLFARYYERLRRSVRARIGPRLRARMETQDILQPALAKAFQNFDRFEMLDENSLLHWLAEHAYNALRDAVRRINAIKRVDPAEPLQLDADTDGREVEVPARVTQPGDAVARDEQEAAIEQCLDELPDHYRQVIVLREYDGLDWRSIAVVMQKNTDSAVRELHRRAVDELGARLARRGIGPGLD